VALSLLLSRNDRGIVRSSGHPRLEVGKREILKHGEASCGFTAFYIISHDLFMTICLSPCPPSLSFLFLSLSKKCSIFAPSIQLYLAINNRRARIQDTRHLPMCTRCLYTSSALRSPRKWPTSCSLSRFSFLKRGGLISRTVLPVNGRLTVRLASGRSTFPVTSCRQAPTT